MSPDTRKLRRSRVLKDQEESTGEEIRAMADDASEDREEPVESSRHRRRERASDDVSDDAGHRSTHESSHGDGSRDGDAPRPRRESSAEDPFPTLDDGGDGPAPRPGPPDAQGDVGEPSRPSATRPGPYTTENGDRGEQERPQEDSSRGRPGPPADDDRGGDAPRRPGPGGASAPDSPAPGNRDGGGPAKGGKEDGGRRPKGDDGEKKTVPRKIVLIAAGVLGVMVIGALVWFFVLGGGKGAEVKAEDFNGTWVVRGETSGAGSTQAGLDGSSTILGISGGQAQMTESGDVTDLLFESKDAECLLKNTDGTPVYKGTVKVGVLTLSDGNGTLKVYEKYSDQYPPNGSSSSPSSSSQGASIGITPFDKATSQTGSNQVPAGTTWQQPESQQTQPTGQQAQVQQQPTAPQTQPESQPVQQPEQQVVPQQPQQEQQAVPQVDPAQAQNVAQQPAQQPTIRYATRIS